MDTNAQKDKIMEKKKEKIENPKHDAGVKKVPFHFVPCGVLMEIGLGMMEGGRKYGAHNYRAIGIKFSDYYDAAWRHLAAWFEGEDIDLKSGQHHITKLITDLIVLRDSMLMGNCEDDRPLKYPNGLDMDAYNKQAEAIIKKIPKCVEPFTEKRNF